MAGRVTFGVEVKGFPALKRKVQSDDLYAEPWHEFMDDLGNLAENAAIAGAPFGPSGQTISHMSHRVQAKPVPLYVVVKTNAKRGRYPYPKFTNFSPYAARLRPPSLRTHRFRRTTPNPNLHWLQKALDRVRPAIEPMLERAAREIERRWAA